MKFHTDLQYLTMSANCC